LSGFGDAARTNAARANPHALPRLANDNVNVLEIWIPSTFRQIMGVTNPMSVNRSFVADLTASHEGNSFEK
jgi:hypothetical protein